MQRSECYELSHQVSGRFGLLRLVLKEIRKEKQ